MNAGVQLDLETLPPELFREIFNQLYRDSTIRLERHRTLTNIDRNVFLVNKRFQAEAHDAIMRQKIYLRIARGGDPKHQDRMYETIESIPPIIRNAIYRLREDMLDMAFWFNHLQLFTGLETIELGGRGPTGDKNLFTKVWPMIDETPETFLERLKTSGQLDEVLEHHVSSIEWNRNRYHTENLRWSRSKYFSEFYDVFADPTRKFNIRRHWELTRKPKWVEKHANKLRSDMPISQWTIIFDWDTKQLLTPSFEPWDPEWP